MPTDPGLMLMPTANEIKVLQEVLVVAINTTPTGKRRNTLTNINIKLMAADDRLFVAADDEGNPVT